jgi:hypothetical protein
MQDHVQQQTPPTNVIDCTDGVTYLLTLASECHPRGGFTIDDAVQLNAVRQRHSDSTNTSADAVFLKAVIFKAQSFGILHLKEAWMAFNALHLLENPIETNSSTLQSSS